MAAQNHAGEFARAERNHQAAARPHAMAQRFRQRVSEKLIERHGQTDVAIEARSFGH